MAKYEMRSNISDWEYFIPTSHEALMLTLGVSSVISRHNNGDWVEIRIAPESPKCKHENYVVHETTAFKNRFATRKSLVYICEDCGKSGTSYPFGGEIE